MSFLLALALSLVLTPLLGRLGLHLGLVDRPSNDGLKIHAQPKPLTGGIGIVPAAFVGAAVAGDAVPSWSISAVLLLLVVGVADDLLTLFPLLRLIAQLAAGVLLAVGGATFGPLGDLGPLAVVVAVPALTNAVNITDGQDGLAAGLGAIAALGISVILATQGEADALGLALVGALIAFLVWNRPPATVFLGDGGAYAIGCLLVVLATGSSRSWESLLGTLLCLGVFALEVVSTVFRRAVRRSPMVLGDRAHVYDLLAQRVAGRQRATALMWAAGAFAAALGWLVAQAPLSAGVAVVAATAVAGSVAVRALWRRPGSQLRRSW